MQCPYLTVVLLLLEFGIDDLDVLQVVVFLLLVQRAIRRGGGVVGCILAEFELLVGLAHGLYSECVEYALGVLSTGDAGGRLFVSSDGA